MQRIWTVVLSVWAMLAIVAVLAWSHRPAPAPPRGRRADPRRQDGERQTATRRRPARRSRRVARDDATSGVPR